MGKDLYELNALAKVLFDKANEVHGYKITDIMYKGTDEDMKQIKVTQPAVFLHSVISVLYLGKEFTLDMVGGHSRGEFSALVAAFAISFEDGLRVVNAMPCRLVARKLNSILFAVLFIRMLMPSLKQTLFRLRLTFWNSLLRLFAGHRLFST